MNTYPIKNLVQRTLNKIRINSVLSFNLLPTRLFHITKKHEISNYTQPQNKLFLTTSTKHNNLPFIFTNINFTSVRNMFIQSQSTPNPDSIKFFPGKEVMGANKSMDFSNIKEARKSPLAKKFFRIEGINHVFFGPDFVSINKEEEADWQQIRPFVYSAFMEFYDSKQTIIDEAYKEPEQSSTDPKEEDDEVVLMIKELLDTRIRPIVMEDGGDIHFRKFVNGIVYLKMQGSCSGCPSSTMTLRNGIENMLMHYIPEVSAVRPSEDLGDDDPVEKINKEQFKAIEEKLLKQASN